jgi:hypothetical protein
MQFRLVKEGSSSLHSVTLPFLCQWYGPFLEESSQSRFKGSMAVLELLQPFVRYLRHSNDDE